MCTDPRIKRIEIGKQFSLSELLDDEVKDILRKTVVDFNKLSPATQKLLRIPLHLDLFVMAMEGEETHQIDKHYIQGITSLQELYTLLWQNIVLKNEPGSPPAW